MTEAAREIERQRTEEITKLLRFGQNKRPVDTGREPITDSPLFGGSQQELFS